MERERERESEREGKSHHGVIGCVGDWLCKREKKKAFENTLVGKPYKLYCKELIFKPKLFFISACEIFHLVGN